MRTIRTILSILGATMLLNSCEFDFEVSSNAKPGLYVQCMADEGEQKLFMKLQYAAPAQGNTHDIPALSLESLRASVDGQELSIEYIPDSCYLAACQLEPGKEIRLSVEAKGLAPVSATCRVPSRISLKGMTHKADTLMMVPMNVLTLEFDRELRDDEFIAVRLERTSWFEGDSVKVETLSPMLDFGSSTEVETAQIRFPSPFLIEARGDSTKVTVIPGSGIKGSTVELTSAEFREAMDGMPMPQMPGAAPLPDPEPRPELLKQEYTATAWTVTESFYRYSLASYKSKSDFMAMMGLAPANFAWSNIRGGFGLCGAFVPAGVARVEP